MDCRTGRRGGQRPRKFYQGLIERLLAFARNEFALNCTQPDGATLRAHLESARRQTGIWPDEFKFVPCPMVMAQVWNWFSDLSQRRASNGYGPNPLSYQEIEAWARLTGAAPTLFEVKALTALDTLYMRESAKRLSEKG